MTIVVVLFLENLVSMAYERRMTRQLARPHSPGAPTLLVPFANVAPTVHILPAIADQKDAAIKCLFGKSKAEILG